MWRGRWKGVWMLLRGWDNGYCSERKPGLFDQTNFSVFLESKGSNE